MRALFPGLVYQLGNFLSSYNAVFQTGLAERRGDDYAFALALFGGLVAIALALWANLGPERRGQVLAGVEPEQ